jgi:hypothetical protein
MGEGGIDGGRRNGIDGWIDEGWIMSDRSRRIVYTTRGDDDDNDDDKGVMELDDIICFRMYGVVSASAASISLTRLSMHVDLQKSVALHEQYLLSRTERGVLYRHYRMHCDY